MKDPRLEEYARLLVERCVHVEAGWQVMVISSPLARPLIEEVQRNIARRGAYAVTRISFTTPGSLPWLLEAPDNLLDVMAPIDRYALEHADAMINIGAPENTREASAVPPERLDRMRKAMRFYAERQMSLKMPWVYCQYPTPALAQDAGMSVEDFEEFIYSACLLDWDAVAARMRHYADRFDRANRVRIVAEGTDLTLSLQGRHGQLADGHFNMPDGEFFYSPVEDATEGVVSFSEFPAVYGGHEVYGARLVFKEGHVVEASARSGEDFLLQVLDSDPGARVLGELGIGCNPGIQQHMKNTLYDEKIDGTIHLAVGNAFPFIGGKNVSSVHWDMVKDLRRGGQLYCDGELVQENGKWLI